MSADPAPPNNMQPGTRLGPYEIIAAIGRGGMGEVYRAVDTRLKRQVAVKILPAGNDNPEFRERFDREARAVAALSHPNIVAIHDVGVHDGIAYAAIELLEGETLRARIGGAPLALATAVDYAAQIGRGLAAAHDRGIVHRDLKPDNVFITRDGQVKILDFGIATEPTPSEADETRAPAQTEPGMVLGTVGYMSPEQARGERVDARSDIFSLGCMLYEMVSGKRAFNGDSRIEIQHAILKDHPPDLAAGGRLVPPVLDRLMRRCLEKTPEGRFQTARDLVFALENVSDATGAPVVALRGDGRRRRRVAVAVILALIVSAAGGLWWVNRDRTATAAVTTPIESPPRLLAVLPFEHIAPGNDEGSFGAGMTEEVSNQLSKLSGLRVVARAALAKYQNGRADLPAMVQELDIGSVVAGSVREDGTRVRVNVELMDARTAQVIWSEQYDREGVDVFAAQSEIALGVAEALKASVTLDEQARLGNRPTTSVAAYQRFVRARTQPSKPALELLTEAVALDPNFAQAYAAIAVRHYRAAMYGDVKAAARGMDAANRAIAIDPQLAAGYHALALNLHLNGRLREALPVYRKAVELNPGGGDGLNDLSFGENTAGRHDEALGHSSRSLSLAVPGSAYHVGVALLQLGDDERTERFLAAEAARSPGTMRLQALLALLDVVRGRSDAAVSRIYRAAEAAPKDIEVLLTRAEITFLAGHKDAPEHVRSLMGRAADGLFHSTPYPVKLAHAYYLMKAGGTAEAARIMDDLLAANREAVIGGANWPMVFMQNAAVHALRGNLPAALDALDQGYEAGWRDPRLLAIDPLLASLGKEPRFSALLTRIQAEVAAMRGRADYSRLP